MKVKVTGACQGHARCWAIAPDIFRLDDDGYVRPDEVEVPARDEKLAARGVRACPERALTLDEG